MKALLVDDHNIIFVGLRMVLSRIGIDDVEEVTDPVVLNQRVKSTPNVLVIMDIEMPGKDGYHMLKSIRNLNPRCQVIIFSKHTNATVIGRFVDEGIQGYINKSTPLEMVEFGIRQVLSGQRFIDNQTAVTLYEGLRKEDILKKLSQREYQVFTHLARGKSYREIAEECHLSIKTVGGYRSRIAEKLELDSRKDFFVLAQKLGLIEE